MTPIFLLQIIAVLTPVIAVAETDRDAFKRAKKKDPSAAFDRTIFALRILKALIAGLTAAVGMTAVPGLPK